ncbi:hypothetical protein [Flagellimonas sp.]|uniref:hypothetical protein n=1 Tax=Flagellimonas sp. TaxID=2058762 RepID=UPI003AB6C980
MTTSYDYIAHKVLAKNKYTLFLTLPIVFIALLVYLGISLWELLAFPEANLEKFIVAFLFISFGWVLFIYFSGILKAPKDFNVVKYSNCSMSLYEALGETEKRTFHKYLIKSIREKDMGFDSYMCAFETYPKITRTLIQDLSSKKFKRRLLSELTFERLNSEIKNQKKKSLWIRSFFSYKIAMERALAITMENVSDASVLNSMNEIHKALAININIGSNGVTLDAKGLKAMLIDINQNVTSVNLENRIILNGRITQKQFALVLDSFCKRYLPNLDAKKFAACYTGFSDYDPDKYNLRNIFHPYYTELSQDEVLTFIALIRYLIIKGVIKSSTTENSHHKLTRILEIFTESNGFSRQTWRKNFSEEYQFKRTLPKNVQIEVNSSINRHLPPLQT